MCGRFICACTVTILLQRMYSYVYIHVYIYTNTDTGKVATYFSCVYNSTFINVIVFICVQTQACMWISNQIIAAFIDSKAVRHHRTCCRSEVAKYCFTNHVSNFEIIRPLMGVMVDDHGSFIHDPSHSVMNT